MVSYNDNSKELEYNDITLCFDLNISKMLNMLYCAIYNSKLDIPKDVDILCL
jgi:hypothetical protein